MAAKETPTTTTKPSKTVEQAASESASAASPPDAAEVGYHGTRVDPNPADHYTVVKVIERETDG